MKKALLTLLSLLLLFSLTACKDSREEEYTKALELIESEKYQEAIEILEPLGDYKMTKDHLWLARMRIVEDYLFDYDFAAGYGYLCLQDDEFLKTSAGFIDPLICAFFDQTYRYLEDKLKIQYEYALKITEIIGTANDPIGQAVAIINENFDQLLNWQSADKLITGCDANLDLTYEAVKEQWKQQDYNSIGQQGTSLRDLVIFYLDDGLKLNETGEKIFMLYDLMANNLESVYIENSYDKKQNSFENFLGFYDMYKAQLAVYESEYLNIINELDKLDNMLLHN